MRVRVRCEVLLNRERSAGFQRAINAVVPPVAVRITVKCVHYDRLPGLEKSWDIRGEAAEATPERHKTQRSNFNVMVSVVLRMNSSSRR